MPSWIKFIETPAVLGRKTRVWNIYTQKEDFEGQNLGEIKFYPQWRKYAFFPARQTLFEQDCLREIATFCEAETTRWRNGKGSGT